MECRAKRPRTFWKWQEEFDIIFQVVLGVVDNSGIEKNCEVCIILSQK